VCHCVCVTVCVCWLQKVLGKTIVQVTEEPRLEINCVLPLQPQVSRVSRQWTHLYLKLTQYHLCNIATSQLRWCQVMP